MRTLILLHATALFALGTQAAAQTADVAEHPPAKVGQKVDFQLYGVNDDCGAQMMKVALCGPVDRTIDGIHALKVTGIQAGDPLCMFAGLAPVEIDLPWKDTLLVEPMIVAWLGKLDSSGAFYLPFDIRALAFGNAALHLQFFEMLAIDPYPWPAVSSPGVRLKAVTV